MKNIKSILADATKYPAAIEANLPAGAPKISTMLGDFASKLPAIPDLPIDLPALPAPPALPAMPTGLGGLRSSRVEVVPVQTRSQVIPSPAAGVLPEVIQRRGF